MATHLKNLSDFSHTTIPSGKDYKIAIIVAEWNAKITGALYQGAFSTLLKHEVREHNILSLTVPGTFELAGAADILLHKTTDVDAVICIGCVIQGDTKHFDFICEAGAQGCAMPAPFAMRRTIVRPARHPAACARCLAGGQAAWSQAARLRPGARRCGRPGAPAARISGRGIGASRH